MVYDARFSELLGVLVGINLSLMAIWDVYDYEKLHVLTASNVFQLGLVWGVATHIGLPHADISSKRMRYISNHVNHLAFLE